MPNGVVSFAKVGVPPSPQPCVVSGQLVPVPAIVVIDPPAEMRRTRLSYVSAT